MVPGGLLPWAHDTRLQQLCSLLLITNISNKSGNLLFAQRYLEWIENVGFWHSPCAVMRLLLAAARSQGRTKRVCIARWRVGNAPPQGISLTWDRLCSLIENGKLLIRSFSFDRIANCLACVLISTPSLTAVLRTTAVRMPADPLVRIRTSFTSNEVNLME